MTFCAIGGREIVGPQMRVTTSAYPNGLTLCEPHGVAYETGDTAANRLAELLGDNHPYVEKAHTCLDDLLNEPCPVRPVELAEPERPLEVDEDTRRVLDEYARRLP